MHKGECVEGGPHRVEKVVKTRVIEARNGGEAYLPLVTERFR